MKEEMHQAMGYDRAITLFSPDGRLLQVEYAKKTVRQGSTALGIVTKEGVVFLADKRIVDKLVVPESVEKIFEIDSHIAATASGILSDARVLINEARLKAQQHHITFDSPIDVLSIVKRVSDIKQIYTQSGGLRPFGVSLLIDCSLTVAYKRKFSAFFSPSRPGFSGRFKKRFIDQASKGENCPQQLSLHLFASFIPLVNSTA